MTKKLLAPSAFVLVLIWGVYGCNAPESDLPPTTSKPAAGMTDDHDHSAQDHAEHDHADHDPDATKTDTAKMTENLASFSPDDRASAMKQHLCPVSGEMLGSMGAPKKIDVDGQAVWICCDGCKEKLLADPQAYLAKIRE